MSKVLSILDSGSGSVIVEIETSLSNSLPNIVIVGFANKSVDEAKERIRGALSNSSIKIPRKRITINLAPADIPKEGSYFDLPMLISVLRAGKIINVGPDKDTIVMGELGLNGHVRPIRGVIGKILASKTLGINKFWIPQGNLEQASLIPDIQLLPITDVKSLYTQLSQGKELNYIKTKEIELDGEEEDNSETSIDDVIGQSLAKRAVTIAIAGNHNIMLNGPPGAGKTMIARTMPRLMPSLSQKEILEITHIHSLKNKNYEKIISKRPFRAPHHTSSNTSIIGGGQNPRPGEISLSHKGILMFDEFPEFSRSVIESLRQPLEDKVITVARAKESVDFPANFLFVATSNPCPCGYFGSSKECTCLPTQILKYQRKTSGPIMDRIDIYVDVEEVKHRNLINSKKQNDEPEIKEKITKAQVLQKERSGKLNSEMTNKEMERFINIEKQAKELLDVASAKIKLSPRAYIKTLKVARTIADLDGSEKINSNHITEALQYRKRDVSF